MGLLTPGGPEPRPRPSATASRVAGRWGRGPEPGEAGPGWRGGAGPGWMEGAGPGRRGGPGRARAAWLRAQRAGTPGGGAGSRRRDRGLAGGKQSLAGKARAGRDRVPRTGWGPGGQGPRHRCPRKPAGSGARSVYPGGLGVEGGCVASVPRPSRLSAPTLHPRFPRPLGLASCTAPPASCDPLDRASEGSEREFPLTSSW